ncbi:SDR family oxidoreductase [Armatimonas sp.]|uniref:SDR family NAD(P)-dependent oxidoreductase n=1 Tax=Armatimonas sp. TaxID=1872638 RepID=UPI00286A3736|nr:SDR family oxidoreductase [Armatimonas sp.]
MNLLITGATGIAAATVRLAMAAGHKVFVTSLNADDCVALGVPYLAADLTDSVQADAAVAVAVQTLGSLEGVFCVVGGSGRRFGDGPLDACTDEGWQQTFALNLDTTFHIARAALRQFLAQGSGGSLVFTGSVLASHPEPGKFATHAYAASKGAILSLVTTLASYYAPQKIRVNAVAPGLVRTPMSQRAQGDAEILELMRTKQPLAEDLLDADEIANAALFLLSESAAQITGQILTVDGGWSVS